MSSSSTSSVEEAVDGAVDVAAPTPEANTTECSARPMDTAQAALSSGHPQKPAQEKIKPAEQQQHDESAEQLRAEIRASVAASPEMASKQAANLFKETPPSLEDISEERSSELSSLRSSASAAAAADAMFAREEGEGESSAFGGDRGEFVGGGGAEERGRLSVSSAPSHRDSAGGESDPKFDKLHEALVDALKKKEEARAELAKATAEVHALRVQLDDERGFGDAWKSEAEQLAGELETERAEKDKALAQLRQAGRKFEQLRAELADKTRRGDKPPDGDDDDKEEAADESLIVDEERQISRVAMKDAMDQFADNVAKDTAERMEELHLECRRLEKRSAVDVLGDEPLAKRPCHRARATEALFDKLDVEPPPLCTSVLEAFTSDAHQVRSQVVGLGERDDVGEEHEWSLLDEWPLLAQSPPAQTDAQRMFARKVNKSCMERAVDDLPRFFGTGAVDLSKPTHKRDVGWQCPICRDRRRFATLPALKTHMTKQHKGERCTRCFAKHPVGKRSKRDLKRHELVCDGDTCPCGWQDTRRSGKSLGLLDHMLNAHG